GVAGKTSGSLVGLVHVWNLTTRRADRVLEGQSGASVILLNTLYSRDTLISQGRNMHVCLWNLAEGRSAVRQTVWGSVTVPFSSPMPQAKLGRDMCIKLWQVTGSEYTVLFSQSVLSSAAVHHEPVMCLDFDPARQSAVSGSSEEGLSSWMLDGQHRLQVTLVNPGISQLCIWGDSKIAASAVWDLHVQAFGWMNLRPLAVLQHHPDMDFKDQGISIWSIINQSSDSDIGCTTGLCVFCRNPNFVTDSMYCLSHTTRLDKGFQRGYFEFHVEPSVERVLHGTQKVSTWNKKGSTWN
uniref:Guanine nucleotide binding protein (G protein), beta polypeptide 1-like n=1 Tax=Oncorhynchus tshawytscha TaxID=74940 RepID=A0A8C8JSC6_ONCTS